MPLSIRNGSIKYSCFLLKPCHINFNKMIRPCSWLRLFVKHNALLLPFCVLCRTHNALQLAMFFLSFLVETFPGLINCKLVFLILRISQRGGLSFFRGIHVITHIRVDISVSATTMATKFGKKVHPIRLIK